MRMIKVYSVLLMLIFSIHVHASTVSDSETLEENNAQEISRIVAKVLSETGEDTIDGEVIKRITYKIVSGLSSEVLGKFLDTTVRYKVNAYIRDLAKDGGLKNLIKNKFNSNFKTEIMWIGADVFVSLAKEAIWKYSTLASRYTQSIVWWVDIGYTDLKAAVNPNKIAGAIDFTIGNSKALADMAIKINDELKTLGKLNWDIKYKEAMSNILTLELEFEKKYCKAQTVKEKDEVLATFKIKCREEKIFGDIFSSGYRDLFNARIDALKNKSVLKIIKFEKNKYAPLFLMLKNQNRDQYIRYVDNFFPEDIAYFLTVNYYYYYGTSKISTVTKNTIIFDYSVKALAQGFALEDFGVFYLGHINNENIDKGYAYNSISKAVSLVYPKDASYSFEYQDANITRKNFAKTLNEMLHLTLYLRKADETNIQSNLGKNVNADYNILVLQKLGIMAGDPSKTNFRKDDALSRLELMIMVVRAVDYCKKNKWRVL